MLNIAQRPAASHTAHDRGVRHLAWLLSIAVLLISCGRSDAVTGPPIADTSLDTTRAARSDLALSELLKADTPGCSAAVGVKGTVVWTSTRGIADLSTGAKLTADTVFDIASVSKQFTAAAVLLLAIDGRLSTQDSVSQHLSGLPGWAGQVRITDLIHHTSGLPDYLQLLEAQGYSYSERTTQAQAVRTLAETPALRFKPGTSFEYSNSNYLLLAEIVHHVAGTPLPRFLQERIFAPLDLDMVMDSTGKIPAKAISYTNDAPDTSDAQVADSAWEQVGAAGIQSSPSDLVRWADNYRTGTIGGKPLLAAQLAGRVPGSLDYRAGIIVTVYDSLMHNGLWAGFSTGFEITPDRNTAVTVSCNSRTLQPIAAALTSDLRNIWT
ncbi:MAG TPA: serine hydrolase domain-containing protein [Kribbellaceae bacterium]|nr:serine hydrolase domain-containing protein [Kribbellaceae bacterium]